MATAKKKPSPQKAREQASKDLEKAIKNAFDAGVEVEEILNLVRVVQNPEEATEVDDLV